MCIHEYLSDKISTIRIQIFATDVSEKSIAKARTAVYDKNEMEGISAERIEQFFTKTNGSYHVKKSIRDMCVFAAHNFLKDPPFAKIDLISCRNVLIYMEPFLQKKAMNTFHYALNEKGYLLLGKSETTGGSAELFLPVGKQEKLYLKKDLPGRFMNIASERREETLKNEDYALRSSQRRKDDFQKEADDILLSKYTPAGVIVNDQLDIVQFRGYTGDFLEPSPGKASLNVLKMARDGLSFELRSALQKSKKTKEAFSKEGIPIDNGKRLVTIEVIPLNDAIDKHFLVLFKVAAPVAITEATASKDLKKSADSKNSAENIRIKSLEKDLVHAREDMRSITEDQEAANEELQSANEELLSGSEELQSLNEELETSKEELQSTNEELITVNQELFDRNEQYNEARIYSEAIVCTIHEPLLVISKDFRIKSANKAFYKNFSITEGETIGKNLFELQNNGWNIPGLESQLLKIQSENEKFLEWETTYTFPKAGKRIICFNAQPVQKENGEDLVLMAMADITAEKEAEKKLAESEARFRTLVEKATSPICILKGENMILEVANEPVFKVWGVGKEALGKPFLDIIPEMKGQPFMGWLQEVYKKGITHYGNEEPAYFSRANGEKETIYFNFVYQPYREVDGTISGVMVLATDVTEQVVARKKVEESEARFRQMSELMPSKITSADPEGNVTYYNKKWLEYTGKSFQELKDLGYYTIIHPDELEEFKKRFRLASETGTDLEMEMRFLNREGEYKWHLNRASPVRDDRREIKMWIGATTDIHDQKTKEQVKDEFISIASHELKTPLTTAKAYIQLLHASMVKSNYKDLLFAEKAELAIDRLNSLVAELLDVSKMQNGKLNLHITAFNFNDMLSDAIQDVQLTAHHHQIIKTGEIGHDVSADKERLKQVIINLLTNAIKYSPKADKVFVNASQKDGQVTVSIKDTGIGIRKANLGKIFNRYYREEERAHHFQGLGIGLSIAYD
ncbi:MAG: PAS domain S-box protein, partial [Bacteroidota bacterium]|nr:PAS domain S-box protein [Bacteroidota bacterium]